MKYNSDILHIIYMYASDHREHYKIVMGQLIHKFKMNDVLIELIVYLFLKSLNIDIIFEYYEEE